MSRTTPMSRKKPKQRAATSAVMAPPAGAGIWEGTLAPFLDRRSPVIASLLVVLACPLVYWWAKRSFGNTVAMLATALFTLTPPVLAHAGLATTDMGLTAGLTAAFFALLLWAETPTWRLSVLLGVATAFALLTKFTTLGYFPAAAFFALLAYVIVERPGVARLVSLAKQRALPFALAV